MFDQIKSTEAELAAMEGQYDQIPPEMNPDGDPVFSLAFKTPEGVKIFEVNSMDYYALHVGMKGLLRYRGNQLLSFGSWIKEDFSMNGNKT